MPQLTRWNVGIAIGVPLLIAALGLAHPARLTFDDAQRWRDLHVVLLPLFPLLGLAPWFVARSVDRTYGVLALVLGYVFACFYTALDVLAGIGAGGLKLAQDRGGFGVVFGLASDLGHVGSIALISASALACGCALRVAGWAAGPGTALVLAGDFGFMQEHVYWPGGGLSMLAIAAGWAGVVWAMHGPGRTNVRPAGAG
ncbi:hypothetical protein [Aeromicrobium sp. NPDC092404]|uniref:hypothetical protein n=1 Tax=Aeromicrobium sp. NPDC092404 TaxID=3154976 RepID=UPI0034247D7C